LNELCLRRVVALGCAALFALALLPGVARADFMWSGDSTSSASWSDTGNWHGATAPAANADAGALSFPALSGCTAACYTSDNDRTGLSADSLTIDDSVGYALKGAGVSLGSGGLTATSSGGSGGPAAIELPLTLTAAQTWSFTDGVGGLDVQKPVEGGENVTVDFGSPAFLEFDAGADLGSLTATGPGGLYLYGLGAISGPVTLNDMTLGNNALSSGTGALTLNGSELDDGYGSSQDATLAVNGAFAIDSASKLKLYIDQDGQVAGTDFSQLTATGNVALAGTLEIDHGFDANGNCTPLAPGQTDNLLTTTGTLTGSFADVVTNSVCGGPAPELQISYVDGNEVQAEVVSSTTTTLAAPATVGADQPVTLTAIITPDSGSPTGTVTFDNEGSPIPGCIARPVSSGSATCVTSFRSGDAAPSLTASFTGTGGYLKSATSAASTIEITPATTSSTPPPSTSPPASMPPPSAPPASTPPPSAPDYNGTLSLTASKLTVTHGAVQIPQRCTSLAPCTGRFTIAVKGRSCASGAYKLGAFKRATAHAKLSSTCTRLLRKASHHRLTASYSSTPQTPQAAQVKKITLALS
jgi:hypothetical protein